MNASHNNCIRSAFMAALLWFPGVLLAQEAVTAMPVNPETKRITYQEVLKVDGSQKQLFNRAIEWINVYYKNPADATRVRNPENGLIEIFHRFELSRIDDKGNKVDAGRVVYTLRLDLKDGRYRYTLTDLNLKATSRFPIEIWMDKTDKDYNPNYALFLTQVDTQVKALIGSLKNNMAADKQQKTDVW